MYFQQDWMMRQIEMLAQFVAKTLFHKDMLLYDFLLEDAHVQGDGLPPQLRDLVAQGRLCEAENLLFDNIPPDRNRGYLELALNFYHSLNLLSDEELRAAQFSREEIYEGMQDMLRKFDVAVPELAL